MLFYFHAYDPAVYEKSLITQGLLPIIRNIITVMRPLANSEGRKFIDAENGNGTYMKRLTTYAAILLFLFTMCGVAAAGIYKWVDEKGVTHFSDHHPRKSSLKEKVKVLPTPRLRFQYEENYKSRYNDPESPPNQDDSSDEEFRTRREHKVELYVTSWCGYCKKARKFFNSRGIPFKEYDIEKDRRAAERKKRLDTRRGVPFAVINGQGIHGYIPAAYEKALAL